MLWQPSALLAGQVSRGEAFGRRRRATARRRTRRQAGPLVPRYPNRPVLLVDAVLGGVLHQRCSGRKLAITVEPLHEPTAPQRRQPDDEADLISAIMEATATLTVGRRDSRPARLSPANHVLTTLRRHTWCDAADEPSGLAG
jgi:hypothetical protein